MIDWLIDWFRNLQSLSCLLPSVSKTHSSPTDQTSDVNSLSFRPWRRDLSFRNRVSDCITPLVIYLCTNFIYYLPFRWKWRRGSRYLKRSTSCSSWHPGCIIWTCSFCALTVITFVTARQSAVLVMIDSVRCISYDRFCPTVRPSDRPSQSGIMPKRLQLRSCGLHWRIAHDSSFLTLNFAAKFQGEHREGGRRMREG